MTYGKWLVFRKHEHLDEMWHTIRRQIESGELGCTTAKSSTMFCNPFSTGGSSQKSGVICVYTSKEDMDEVGLRLIQLVQNTIRYKTDEATLSGKYSCRGSGKITCRTIYWNDGMPSFEKSPTSPSSKSPPATGAGKPMMRSVMSQNLVRPRNPIPGEKYFGKWVIVVDFDRTTKVWHLIKQQVENGELPALEAECPESARGEKPAIHIYTSEERVDEVGEYILRHIVGSGTVISYEVDAPSCTPQQRERHTKTLQMSHEGDLIYGRPHREERVGYGEQQNRSKRRKYSDGEGPDTGDRRRDSEQK